MKKFLKENWFLILVIIYIISPFDIIPEALLPIFGYTDDVSLLILELIRRIVFKSRVPINKAERIIIEGQEVKSDGK